MRCRRSGPTRSSSSTATSRTQARLRRRGAGHRGVRTSAGGGDRASGPVQGRRAPAAGHAESVQRGERVGSPGRLRGLQVRPQEGLGSNTIPCSALVVSPSGAGQPRKDVMALLAIEELVAREKRAEANKRTAEAGLPGGVGGTPPWPWALITDQKQRLECLQARGQCPRSEVRRVDPGTAPRPGGSSARRASWSSSTCLRRWPPSLLSSKAGVHRGDGRQPPRGGGQGDVAAGVHQVGHREVLVRHRSRCQRGEDRRDLRRAARGHRRDGGQRPGDAQGGPGGPLVQGGQGPSRRGQAGAGGPFMEADPHRRARRGHPAAPQGARG